jgi:hypothetical protein
MLNKAHFLRTGILLFVVLLCSSWGFLVHKTVTQLAIYQLPKEMRAFFYQYKESLVAESIGPDLRRNSDPKEAPRHFIDLEKYGDSAAWKMPLRWEDAIRLYTLDSLGKNGYVPYSIMMLKDRLTQAFRNGNRDSILFYAADLGHYIGDAHVPLHSTINYDGQLSNQKGIHNLWESEVPDLELDQYQLYNGHEAAYLPDPAGSVWNAIRHAHGMLDSVFSQEVDISRSFNDSTKYQIQMSNGKETRSYSRGFASQYGDRLGKSINQQLLASSNLIADFWYTAWVDAGKPNLGAENLPANREDLEKEYQAYIRNQLIQKHLLLSRQGSANR